MLTFERVDIDTANWADKITSYPDRTIFQTPAWLAFVANTQNAEPVLAVLKDAQQILGYFTGLIVRKFVFRILGSPFPGWTTSYMGLCLSPGVSRRIAVEALVRFAFHNLGCVHLEFMDRNMTADDLSGLGFHHKIFAGFEVDLTHSEDEILGNMSKSCRWGIRKAQRNGIVIEEAHDVDFGYDYYAQLKDVFAKQSLVPTYGVERACELIKYIYPTGMLLLLRARHPDGRCIATGIFPAMNQTMYFWGGASWRQDQHLLPNEAIQWYAITYWRNRGIRRYDMGGLAEYKRKYGGREIFVPWFRKSKYSSIAYMRSFAQKLFQTRQEVLGKWKHSTSLT